MEELVQTINALTSKVDEIKISNDKLHLRVNEIEMQSEKSDRSSVGSDSSRKDSFVTARTRRRASNQEVHTEPSESDSFLAAIDGAKRRNTIYPEPEQLNDGRILNKPSLVISAYEVKEGEKILKLTVKSFQKLVKDYSRYKSTSADRRLNMVAFLSHAVLEMLINDQYKKGLVDRGELNISKIQDYSDNKLYRVIAEYLRPNSLQEYKEKLWSSVTDFKKALPKGCLDFNLEQYEEHVFPNVSKLCTEIQAIDDLFRYKASSDSLRDFPKQGFTSGAHGEKSVNIFLQCFVPLDANFRTYISDDNLKSVRSTKEFITAVLEANDRLAQESMSFRRTKARVTPSQPMSEQRHKFEQENELKRRSFQQDRQPSREVSRIPRYSILKRNPVAELDGTSEDELYFDTPLDQSGDLMFGQAVPFRPRQVVGTSNQQRAPGPCYVFMTTGKCDTEGCKYQHDKELAASALLKRANAALASPLYPVKSPSRDAHLKDVQSALMPRKLALLSDGDQLQESSLGALGDSSSAAHGSAFAELPQSKEVSDY